MSNKVIIDGVDVSECGFLDNHCKTKLLLCEECNSDFAAMECKDYHDCYYKQLKRLEFENKLLKADYEASEEENKKLKQALERIKEVLSFCYSEESTEIPCIDCKYYKECGLQPDDYVIKIAKEALKDKTNS